MSYSLEELPTVYSSALSKFRELNSPDIFHFYSRSVYIAAC